MRREPGRFRGPGRSLCPHPLLFWCPWSSPIPRVEREGDPREEAYEAPSSLSAPQLPSERRLSSSHQPLGRHGTRRCSAWTPVFASASTTRATAACTEARTGALSSGARSREAGMTPISSARRGPCPRNRVMASASRTAGSCGLTRGISGLSTRVGLAWLSRSRPRAASSGAPCHSIAVPRASRVALAPLRWQAAR